MMTTGFIGYGRDEVTHLVMTEQRYPCAAQADQLGTDAVRLATELGNSVVVVDLQLVTYG